MVSVSSLLNADAGSMGFSVKPITKDFTLQAALAKLKALPGTADRKAAAALLLPAPAPRVPRRVHRRSI